MAMGVARLGTGTCAWSGCGRHPRGQASSEQAAILREDHREVLAALAQLPPRRREAIVLRYWLDLSEREIAAAMGVSQGR